MMLVRHLEEGDYGRVSPVMDDWWGGRPVRHLLPRLFFQHFADTSFAATQGDELVGFLVGFRSQSQPAVAYVHFVGVSPAARGKAIGRTLYRRFFAAVRALGCTEVRCITSPVNAGSIAFHARLGFAVLPGNGAHDGVPVALDYAGPGQHRVLFSRALQAQDDGA